MFILEAPKVTVPKRITEPNSYLSNVKRSLDELAGLTNLDFDIKDVDSSFLGRPSFRDLGPFVFQPQNVVANQDVLFYKADSSDHRQKLQTLFPYVLNAITPQLLAKQHELEQLRRELRRKKNELQLARQVSENWLAEIRAKITEARELGLTDESVNKLTNRQRMVEILAQIVATSGAPTYQVTPRALDEAVQELMDLQKEESEASMLLSGLRGRLSEMTALRENSKEYEGALQLQRDRLKISEWLATHENNDAVVVNDIETPALRN